MKEALIIKLMTVLYRAVFRDLLIKAISDDTEVWDDYVLKAADGLFGFEG